MDKANVIHRHAILLLHVCFQLGCIVSIENPARSWLWALLAQLVKQHHDAQFVTWYFSLTATMFDACMHGSMRNKSTTFLGAAGVFDSLGIRCDGSHTHQPRPTAHSGWVFDTAAEAEYPSLLSCRLAACILRHVPTEQLHLKFNTLRFTSLQVQGRQHKTMPQMIPDFSNFFWVQEGYKPNHNEKLLPPKTAGDENEVESHADSFHDGGLKDGVFLEPEQHIQRALTLQYPMDASASIPDMLKRAVFRMLTTEPHMLAKERLEMLKLYKSRAEQLQQDENMLQAGLPGHVQQVAKGKRLLLLTNATWGSLS